MLAHGVLISTSRINPEFTLWGKGMIAVRFDEQEPSDLRISIKKSWLVGLILGCERCAC
jgi:hypothetical protein